MSDNFIDEFLAIDFSNPGLEEAHREGEHYSELGTDDLDFTSIEDMARTASGLRAGNSSTARRLNPMAAEILDDYKESKVAKKTISDETIRNGIRKMIASGATDAKITAALDKLAELAVFNRSMANEYLQSGNVVQGMGMSYLEPNHFMEHKRFVAAKNIAKARRDAESGLKSTPIAHRYAASGSRLSGNYADQPSHGFTITAAVNMYQSGKSIPEIVLAGKRAGARLDEVTGVVKTLVASMKKLKLKVNLANTDCSWLKNKLATANPIVGSEKCAGCSYRSGMHCGRTGGTLVAFPGMNTVGNKRASRLPGNPIDGNKLLADFELDESNPTELELEFKSPDRLEVELNDFSTDL